MGRFRWDLGERSTGDDERQLHSLTGVLLRKRTTKGKVRERACDPDRRYDVIGI